MHRINIDDYFLGIALLVAMRSTCVRRQVGAVAVDENNYILSTGYNGVPSGAKHCVIEPCGGHEAESGQNLDGCEAIHAEINAITHSPDPQAIHKLYVTVSPCMSCMKAIIATGCRNIIATEIYDKDALKYFTDNGGFFSLIAK